jgi:thioredoxin 1
MPPDLLASAVQAALSRAPHFIAPPKELLAMASPDVVTLQDSTFDQEVLKSDLPVLVDFWAVWCGPCKAIAPAVDDIARRYKGKLKVGKMDVDEHQQVPQSFGIRSIPTLLIFKGGKVVGTVVGADKSKIEEAVKKVAV